MLKAIAVEGVSLNIGSIGLTEVGQTAQLIATITPDDAEYKSVIWSSSNESIATVDSNGLVTCVTPGDCTITVTTVDGGFTATCSVVNVKMGWFLLVGGGGGGGRIGGGGGAGGYIECKSFALNPASYSVVIGSGGMRAQGQSYTGCNGGNSCFGSIIAYGGGGGASSCSGAQIGCNGGSGGGGAWGCCGGGSGCSGQGNNGGNSLYVFSGGGGGGAGEKGGDGDCPGTYPHGGKGGDGKCSCISGELCWYAGGGGGGNGTGCCSVNGGCGGGGNGGYYNCDALMNATYYGGGGGSGKQGYAGCGCQGIFILAYPKNYGINVTGGTKYECNGYCMHCFTSNGTLIIS